VSGLSRVAALAFALLVLLGTPRRALADPPPRAVFALVIGANTSVDEGLAPLHYADDDAARYFELFRLLGMHALLLTRVDESSRKLHPQAAAEARLPRRDAFDAATRELASEVAQAKARGMATTLYFVFAGHGGVDGDHGYVALEDARLSGDTLERDVVSRIDADAVHVILDACDSYLVAYSRGPGGERQAVKGFVQSVSALARDPRVGLLLSTSSAAESHEWDAFEAGVFSHEVRSGLYGAADADGDGAVSYREIAAFIGRANEAIVNDRYRPHVFARPAAGGSVLLDLAAARGRTITVDGAHAGHYLLEDARGVRLADFHNARDQTATLVRPPPTGVAYLRRLDDDVEFTIPAGDGPLAVASLAPQPPRVGVRGALHDSFSHLFAMPFDEAAVQAFVLPPPEVIAHASSPEHPGLRRTVGWGLVGLGAVGLGAGAYFAVHAATLPLASSSASGAVVAARNGSVVDSNRAAVGSFVAGGLVAAGGLAVFLWPKKAGPVVTVGFAPGGATLTYGATF